MFFSFVYSVFLEVAIARAEEERQMSLVGDTSGDSSLDRFSWSMDSLRRWQRKLSIQHREYKAVSCCLLFKLLFLCVVFRKMNVLSHCSKVKSRLLKPESTPSCIKRGMLLQRRKT